MVLDSPGIDVMGGVGSIIQAPSVDDPGATSRASVAFVKCTLDGCAQVLLPLSSCTRDVVSALPARLAASPVTSVVVCVCVHERRYC